MVVRILGLCMLALVGCTSGPVPDPAHELAQRIVAPCCWRQSLADHDSPLATELRAEIATRLQGGEAPTAIEGDFVARYGPRVLTMGRGDPRPWIAGMVALATLAGLALAIGVGRRWRRRTTAAPPVITVLDDEDEDRLDDELARFA